MEGVRKGMDRGRRGNTWTPGVAVISEMPDGTGDWPWSAIIAGCDIDDVLDCVA